MKLIMINKMKQKIKRLTSKNIFSSLFSIFVEISDGASKWSE
jgi:hypothetical protein